MTIDRVLDGGSDVLPSRLGPWPKACRVCALRRSDPQELGAVAQEDLRLLVASGALSFHCLHRTTGSGRHQECACAAAIARTADALGSAICIEAEPVPQRIEKR